MTLLGRVVANEPLLGGGGGSTVLHGRHSVPQNVESAVSDVVKVHLVVCSHCHGAERAATHSLRR